MFGFFRSKLQAFWPNGSMAPIIPGYREWGHCRFWAKWLHSPLRNQSGRFGRFHVCLCEKYKGLHFTHKQSKIQSMMGEWLSSIGILKVCNQNISKLLCAAMLSKVSAFARNALSHPLTSGHVWCQEPTNPLIAAEQRNGHGHTAFFWSSVVRKTKKIDFIQGAWNAKSQI